MAGFIDISPANAIPLKPENMGKNPAWNGVDPYYDWLINSYLSNQVKRASIIPVQRTDRTVIIVKSSAGSLQLSITDRLGNVVATVLPFLPLAVPGDVDPVGDPYKSLVYDFNLYNLVGADGFYFIHVPNDAKIGGNFLISEPLNLRRKHRDTIYLKYRNTTIKDKTQYYYPGRFEEEVYFYKRINGVLGNRKSTSDTTSYRGQGLSYYKPYDQNYRGLTATFGYFAGGIPDYDIDILGFAASCDTLFIDRIQVTRADGAELTKNFPDNYPLGSATIDVIPTDENQSRLYNYATELLVYTPTGFPYDLRSFSITGDYSVSYTKKTAIYNDEDENSLLDFLNGQYVIDSSLPGYFAFKNHSLHYYNGGTGTYFSEAGSEIWYKPVKLTVGGTANNFGFNYVCGTAFDVVTYQTGMKSVATTPTGTNSYNKTYATGVPLGYMDLFFPPTGTSITQFTIPASAAKSINNITGAFPAGFQQFSIDVFAWPVADMNFLSLSKATVTLIRMTNGGMTSLNTAVLGTGWSNTLRDFRANGNKLTSSNIDGIINAIDISTVHDHNGILILNNQTPSAPPTPASIGARGDLALDGWTITTD